MSSSPHTKLFTAFCAVLSVFFAFDAGLDAGRHWYVSMALDFILGSFFAITLVLIIRDRIHDAKHAGAKALADEATEKMEEIFAEAAAAGAKAGAGLGTAMGREIDPAGRVEADSLTAQLMETIDFVTGGHRAPTKSELPSIERLFEDRTNHKAVLTLETGGLKVEIRKEPTKPMGVVGDTLAAKAAPKNIPVKDGDAERERRSVAGKKAAATRKARQEAAEAVKVREARRAKRAAQRAAKK